MHVNLVMLRIFTIYTTFCTHDAHWDASLYGTFDRSIPNATSPRRAVPFICEPLGIFMDSVVLRANHPVWERCEEMDIFRWSATKVAGRTAFLHWPLKVGEAEILWSDPDNSCKPCVVVSLQSVFVLQETCFALSPKG